MCELEVWALIIRHELKEDVSAIRSLITVAFENMAFSIQTEAAIVDALRLDNALSCSLVAVENDVIVGYIAFSRVAINSEVSDWYGLGPIAVKPDRQRSGIGTSLIHRGLEELKSVDAQGCVLLGDPKYYGRFGFKTHHQLHMESGPSPYFQALSFTDRIPRGRVDFHSAFQTN